MIRSIIIRYAMVAAKADVILIYISSATHGSNYATAVAVVFSASASEKQQPLGVDCLASLQLQQRLELIAELARSNVARRMLAGCV